MKRFVEIALLTLALTVAASCHRPTPRASVPKASSSLAAIDTMIWKQPDSAFRMLLDFAESPSADSLDTYNGHYLQLLIAELLYKNDYQQTNRTELLRAVDYFDTLVARGGTPAQAFLDARAHYINGVGFYERDSVVKACQEYLHTLEIMETHFPSVETNNYASLPAVPHIPRFMALTYNRLGELFSEQFMSEQTISCCQKALFYEKINPQSPYSISKSLYHIGIHFDIIGSTDSSTFYFQEALEKLPDTLNVIYRDIITSMLYSDYHSDSDGNRTCNGLKQMIQQAGDSSEMLSRYLALGGIYYEEKLFDSAIGYLDAVFEHSMRIPSKIQAADYLKDIYQHREDSIHIEKYSVFLSQYAVPGFTQTVEQSVLAGLFQKHMEQEKSRQYYREADSIRKRNSRTFVLVLVVVLPVLVFAIRAIWAMRTRKRRFEEQLSEERYAHEIKQKSLGERLKASDEALQRMKDQLVQQNNISNPLGDGQALDAFKAEPICRLILERVEEGDFLSQMDCKMYKKYALDKAQLASLRDAADRNLNRFTFRIGSNYPKLTRGDMDYCCLYLLGLSDADVSALIQRAYSTVNERHNKLERILGSKTSLFLTLQAIANGATIN